VIVVNGPKFEQITKALEKTGGQCPCVPRYAWTEDTFCQPLSEDGTQGCKNFREQTEVGACHCQLYELKEN